MKQKKYNLTAENLFYIAVFLRTSGLGGSLSAEGLLLREEVSTVCSVPFSRSVVSDSLWPPMDCSKPVFHVHYKLSELAQTHVWVGDAIQPSHPLSSPSPSHSIFCSIRVFSNESVLCIRWPKYWSFSFSISPSSEYSGLISFRIDWFDLFASKGFSRVFSNTAAQKHQFFGTQLSL